MTKPVIYACIPAWNEEKNIGRVILLTRNYVDKVFVCDDGSEDMTGDLSDALGAMVIRNEKNVGKGGALRVLFREALKGSPDAIVVLDADGQHDPAFIPNLVKPILSGAADMVIGSRFVEGSKSDAPLYRRIGLKLFNRGNGAGVRDVQSGLRAYSPSAVEIINRAEANGFGVETEQVRIAENKGLRILEVPVEIHYNGVHKPSKKNPLMHGADLLKTMLRLATEERPLLLLGVPGALFFSVGMVSGILLRARVGS